ncbi:tripartite tricarboxylate transporter TctB family protein [Aliiroseovarius sp.]|uniref:tripartite tricarboxylate transporter TctB family protein n=1 Tax=Aliiroseovarius sp. TaxID=1872442 RepID=UPI003BA93D12
MSGRVNEATVVGGMIAVFGLFALGAGLAIEADAQGNANARIFPVMGAGALVLLGALEFRRGWQGGVRPLVLSEDLRAVLSLLALAIGYTWLVGKLGYLMSTGLVAPLAMWLFGIRHPLGLALAAVICPAAYHLIFFELMGVFPPFGEWFDLLDLIQGGF